MLNKLASLSITSKLSQHRGEVPHCFNIIDYADNFACSRAFTDGSSIGAKRGLSPGRLSWFNRCHMSWSICHWRFNTSQWPINGYSRNGSITILSVVLQQWQRCTSTSYSCASILPLQLSTSMSSCDPHQIKVHQQIFPFGRIRKTPSNSTKSKRLVARDP